MKIHLFTLIILLFCSVAYGQSVDTAQQITPGRTNGEAQQKKPYVILISADGFRYNYIEEHHAKHLLKLSNQGVRAESMIPSYPSLTFPNHYALVTGLYPSHNGIVHNDFYSPLRKQVYSMSNKSEVKDGSWYGGTPLWVLAEQQQMLTASFYWVASEADIKGVVPTYYYQYNTSIGIHQRIQTVVNWLKMPESKRPHLITFYFPEVDHEAHLHGPDSPRAGEAVRYIDSAVYQLTQAVKSTGLDVNFIFVSDHGMTRVDDRQPIPVLSNIDTAKFKTSGDGILIELYANNPLDIQAACQKLKSHAKNYKVYLKDEMPANLHYNSADDKMNRIGDILLVPDWPKVFQYKQKKTNPGWHGFDPYLVKDMHAVFLAWGPAFKQNLKIASFENVNVYPVISTILNLPYTDQIDGTTALADKILK